MNDFSRLNRRDLLSSTAAVSGAFFLPASLWSPDAPTTDPARSLKLKWTGKIRWGNVIDFTTLGGDGKYWDKRLAKAQSMIASRGGGVVFFPKGRYHFSDYIRLKDGVVIRGETPPAKSTAHDKNYSPPTRFEFPKYVPTFEGKGTPIDTAGRVISKQITAVRMLRCTEKLRRLRQRTGKLIQPFQWNHSRPARELEIPMCDADRADCDRHQKQYDDGNTWSNRCFGSGLMRFRLFLCLVFLVAGSGVRGENKPADKGLALFNKSVLPLLKKHCYKCHSHGAKEAEGGLVLDSRQGWQKGGTLGPAIVPGKPEKSLLIWAVHYKDKDLQMPPDGKLKPGEIEILRKWIAAGAADPRKTSGAGGNKKTHVIAAKDLWSLKPVKQPPVPKVKDDKWPWDDLDRFILARLERDGLRPVKDAAPERLLRRLSFDLTGLPPSVELVQRVLKKPDRATFAAVVDELLRSPAFGERWGRHWLDTARYADTLGGDRDRPLRYAFRYRNWVIDAINADKPYDQFLREQLAGDLLTAKDWKQRESQLIATGFLAVGSKPLPRILPIQTEAEKKAEYERAANDWADDQIDAVGRGMLGMTIACARCHDHKYDPIPTSDYYAMAGIFRSTELRFSMPYFLIADAPDADYPFEPWYYFTGKPEEVNRAEAMLRQWQQADRQRRPLRARLRMLRAKIRRAEQLKKRKPDQLRPAERALIGQLDAMRVELPTVEKRYIEAGKVAGSKPNVQQAIGAREAKTIKDVPILLRGEWDKKDKVIPRGFLTAVSGPKPVKIPPNGSGRLQLAGWVTDARNPLTSRVAVNRIWYHLFGRGIVQSLDNFGSTGTKPSHPELLNRLAYRFMHVHKWSLKKAVREIVLSRTYQLAAVHDDAAFKVDPMATQFWRARPRRLEAESIRDSLLFVAGKLDSRRPTTNPLANTRYTNNTSGDKEAVRFEQGNHHSIYVPVVRGRLTEFQTLFDQPVPDEVNSARNTSTLASQALYFMNGKLPQAAASAVADRVLRDKRLTDDTARIESAYLILFGRKPTTTELKRDRKFLDDFTGRDAGTAATRRSWIALCTSMLMSADFLYRF